MQDSSERFSAVAEAYQRYRPGYPTAVLDWIARVTGVRAGARVADLGCGTGIFSRLLASRGYTVVGIDPNDAMLAQARAAGGGPTYLAGDATRTGLADRSVELVTSAQAFHWFPLEPTLAELDRILVPGGWTCALWNKRTPSPFNREYEELLRRFSRDYSEKVNDLLHDPRARLAAAIPGAIRAELAAGDLLTWEAVLGRVRSASYVAHGVDDLAGFERGLRRLYERHARPDGTLEWAMETVTIAWPRPA
ncbi:MAG TPA: methyltransferase domain-containing protein [Candidatus Acidoferrum sp.]|nr:methyltransferase domain-containing protein [Candidatus Acidoferrum sp.]